MASIINHAILIIEAFFVAKTVSNCHAETVR